MVRGLAMISNSSGNEVNESGGDVKDRLLECVALLRSTWQQPQHTETAQRTTHLHVCGAFLTVLIFLPWDHHRGEVIYWVSACFVLKFALQSVRGEGKGGGANFKTKHMEVQDKFQTQVPWRFEIKLGKNFNCFKIKLRIFKHKDWVTYLGFILDE